LSSLCQEDLRLKVPIRERGYASQQGKALAAGWGSEIRKRKSVPLTVTDDSALDDA